MADKKYVEIDQIVMELKRFVGYLDADMLYRLEIAVKRLPAADVRPVVRGKWEEDGHHIICSICGEYMCIKDQEGIEIPREFCPNCGADMRGEAE